MREVFVYNNRPYFGEKWTDIIEFVKVERTTFYKSKISVKTAFYLSTKKLSAKDYYDGIRGHWSIENSLHYVKDVTFKEDFSQIKSTNAVIGKSIIINLILNIFHRFNYDNIAQTIRMVSGNFALLQKVLE